MGRTICHRLIPLSQHHLEDGEEKDPSKGRSKGSEFHEEEDNRRMALKISGEESGKIHSRRKRE